jgi:hypothetical protein
VIPSAGGQPDSRPAPRSASTWRLPGDIELSIDGGDLAGSSVRSLDLFQAIDRPDRLEARLLPPSERIAGEALAGRPVTLRIEARTRFAGLVETVSSGFHEDIGGWLTVVAYARYQSLRSAAAPSLYYQVTDSELARRIAGELELVPVVDSTEAIRPRVEVRGDRLAVLRAAAARTGYHLAVTGGRLYFVRDLPTLEEVRPPDLRREALSCRWRCSRSGERRGTIEALGSGRWRPLVGFRLRGAPGVEDGHYRVDRVVHSLGLEGFRTELEVTERSLAPAPGR